MTLVVDIVEYSSIRRIRIPPPKDWREIEQSHDEEIDDFNERNAKNMSVIKRFFEDGIRRRAI